MGDTDVIRRFNRTYTQRIGALDESFLGLGLPLGLARLVFEIGSEPGDPTVRDLRVRLGLDSGHLARQLRSLEERELVEVRPDPADRRRRVVTLTRSGRVLRRRLDDRSEHLAARLVEPLTERQRARLTEALATADLLVRAATVDLVEVDPRSPAARSAVGHYFAELDTRFAEGFDVAAAEADDLADPELHAVRFLVATSAGEPVACGGVRELEPGVGEIKRMWVHDGWRGAGLGARLLRRLEDVAQEMGHRIVRLDTNGTLTEAIAMYERAGYRPTERYNDNPYAQAFFVKHLSPETRPAAGKVRRP
ncbi:GNAT family N-acetyltransferase [Nocardioides dilutus]